MSEKEILDGCRKNGTGYKYLRVLCDLNCCSVEEIEKVLRKAGWEKDGSGHFVQPVSEIMIKNTEMNRAYFKQKEEHKNGAFANQKIESSFLNDKKIKIKD